MINTTNQANNEKKPAKATGSASEYNKIKKVIAVMSGKGGVGKSFVTGLLATSLAREGYEVGVLDADITGPSIPTLFGLHGPVNSNQYGILPLTSKTGIKVISMNLLIEGEDNPLIWRGPLIAKAITQLWGDVMWGNLDYLLIDLPPGTSDAALTIMQLLPVDGIVMVTTPQSLATMIVNKAVNMAIRVGVPIIGVVENMAYYPCPDTGKRHMIFGESNGEKVAKAAHAPLLAQIPINPVLTQLCDFGEIEDIEFAETITLMEAFEKAMPIQGKTDEKVMTESVKETKWVFAGAIDDPKKPLIDSGAIVNDHDQAFSDVARQLIRLKENMGCFEKPDACGKVTGWCGDTMEIQLMLDGDVIKEARFMTDGCGATIACGSMLTKMAQSKPLSEVMKISPEDLLTELISIPEDHEHCLSLAVSTLRAAVNQAMEKQSAINLKN